MTTLRKSLRDEGRGQVRGKRHQGNGAGKQAAWIQEQ